MFCPKCSQSQISEDVRFCSRCGLPLEAIAEIVANDGALTLAPAEEKKGLITYLRRKKAIVGAKITFFSLFLLPVAFAIALAADGPAPLLLALIPFFIGLAQMLYAIIFGKNSEHSEIKPNPAILGKQQHQSLTAKSSQTSALPPITVETLKMPESAGEEKFESFVPPSVTEETTKLLEGNK